MFLLKEAAAGLTAQEVPCLLYSSRPVSSVGLVVDMVRVHCVVLLWPVMKHIMKYIFNSDSWLWEAQTNDVLRELDQKMLLLYVFVLKLCESYMTILNWIYSGGFGFFISHSSAYRLRGHRGVEVHLKITFQPGTYCFTSGILSAL